MNMNGQPYNIVKTGSNFISIANTLVDGAFANMDITQGTIELNGTTTWGDPTKTNFVRAGATLQLFGNVSVDKQFLLFGRPAIPRPVSKNAATVPGNGAL